MAKHEVVVVSAARTAIGDFGGGLIGDPAAHDPGAEHGALAYRQPLLGIAFLV